MISGKPFFTWPAVHPDHLRARRAAGGALGAVLGMFALNRLPSSTIRCSTRRASSASTDDGFFISIEAWDPKFDATRRPSCCARPAPPSVELVTACGGRADVARGPVGGHGRPRAPIGSLVRLGARCPRCRLGGCARRGRPRRVAGARRGGTRASSDFSWLVAFLYFLTIALGGLFFVLIHTACRAGWGVAVRRVAENADGDRCRSSRCCSFRSGSDAHELFHWSDAGRRGARPRSCSWQAAVPERALLPVRAPDLLRRRGAALAVCFSRQSRRQDADRRPAAHRGACGARARPGSSSSRSPSPSPPSTGSCRSSRTGTRRSSASTPSPARFVASFAFLIVAIAAIQRAAAPLRGVVTDRAPARPRQAARSRFTVFWAYIAFSQFFLIWYANIPEETDLLHRARWRAPGVDRRHGRSSSATSLVPFFFLMPRAVKRNAAAAGGGGALAAGDALRRSLLAGDAGAASGTARASGSLDCHGPARRRRFLPGGVRLGVEPPGTRAAGRSAAAGVARVRERLTAPATQRRTTIVDCVRDLHVAAGPAVCWHSLACCAAAFARRTVTGTVTYDGKVPNLKPLAMDADPVCAAKHTTPVPNEMLVLGAAATRWGTSCAVVSGLPPGKTYPPPKDAVVMDQNGCHYNPHVFGRHGRPDRSRCSTPTACCTTCTRCPR